MTDHQRKDDPRIGELIERFDKFVEQYELDMRGDKNVSNGHSGLVGEIRKLKDVHTRYPSITWLLAHKPFQTGAVIIGTYIGITALYTFGLLKLFAAMFGVNLP